MTTQDPRRFRSGVYEQFARVGKALASPRRFELLDLLCQAERTVEALARAAGLSVTNTSQHLQVLRAARLVDREKDGLFATYRIADETVCGLVEAMRVVAEQRLAEVEQMTQRFLEGREGMEPVDKEALMSKVRDGDVMVLDVRPAEEYRSAHVSGAISLPLEQLEHRLAELPKDQEIVAYCRGRYCVLAVRAVELLRAKGYEAFRLEEGVRELARQGVPISVPSDAADQEEGSS